MATARQKIVIGGGVFLGLLLVLLLVVLLTNRGTDQDPVASPTDIQTGEDIDGGDQSGILAPLPNEPVEVLNDRTIEERVGAKQAARIFVERFGTYSNQNDNEHIDLAVALATPSMQQWIETNMVTQGGSFVGKTTEVLASSVAALDTETAEILIQVREINETDAGVETVLKNGRVLLELSTNGVWLVDGLFYES